MVFPLKVEKKRGIKIFVITFLYNQSVKEEWMKNFYFEGGQGIHYSFSISSFLVILASQTQKIISNSLSNSLSIS